MSNMKTVVEDSFTQYSGAVLQSRALVDVRDCIKPSARQILYCLYTDGFLNNKPFKKTLKAIGSAVRVYIHGDSSCVGILMRAGQPFAMRYPLIQVKGSYGNLIESGNWASERYTSSRLSKLSEHLFLDLKKNTIQEWRDNYDDTEQYPSVTPSKGFYNIVNGMLGIGIGASASIPPTNLKEVNEALIKLLWDPEISDEEVLCMPDFPTGATLLNEQEVRESLKAGRGKSCKLRATVNFEEKERVLVVTEIPYGVYTNTICRELEHILNDDENNPGIDRFNDLTGENPLIKIYLNKKSNVNKVLKYLYKNTSLQSYYGINMTMLKDGRYPQVFTWKQALLEHLAHEEEVYTRGFEFDLQKIKDRLHIIEGILVALNNLDSVIQDIRHSQTTTEASNKLQQNYELSSIQAKAILDIKLSRLVRLEKEKFETERDELLIESKRIKTILDSPSLLKKEIEQGFRDVIKHFGDSRKTTICNIEAADEEEPVEIKSLVINLTNKNNLFATEVSSLYSQKRGSVGMKFKLDKDEYIVETLSGETNQKLLLFTELGEYYSCSTSDLMIGEKVAVEALISSNNEKIVAMCLLNKKSEKSNILFITKQGIIKKSLLEVYNTKRASKLKAINLNDDDSLVSIFTIDKENIGILTKQGNFVVIETSNITSIGRVAKGIKGIGLSLDDEVVSAKIVPDTTNTIISIASNNFISSTDFSDFKITGRGTKGVKIQKVQMPAKMVDFLPIKQEKEVLVCSKKSQIKIPTKSISITGRGAVGVKAMELKEENVITGLTKVE